MHAQGFIVDSIAELGSRQYSFKTTRLRQVDKSTLDESRRLKIWLLRYRNIASAGEITTPLTYDAFERTMLCGMDIVGRPAPAIYSKYFLSYIRFINEAIIVFSEIINGSAPLVSTGPIITGHLYMQAVLRGLLPSTDAHRGHEVHGWIEMHLHINNAIEDSLQEWVASKLFCRTQGGRLARVPQHAVENDLICVLYGSEMAPTLSLESAMFMA
jgi:hypothetical protein